MFNKTYGTKGQGNVGIAAAILYFTTEGYTVSIPLNDSQDYDLIIGSVDELKRVQVKTTKYKTPHGIYQVTVKSSGGTKGKVYHRVSESSCDLLYVLCENSDQYLIPKEVFIKYRNTINLGDEFQKYRI